MSTSVTREPRPTVSQSGDEKRQLTLAELSEKLSSLEDTPSLAELNNWLQQTAVESEELGPYKRFKPATYARHRVMRNEHAELLVLRWNPGQRTPIHDHNGSHGAVLVCEGVLWETMFALDDEETLVYNSACEWRSGQVTGADVPDIHQLGNPEVSGQKLVTIHIYAPPLGVLNTYTVGSREIGHYSPDEFMYGGGI